jgi:hypothetical protein
MSDQLPDHWVVESCDHISSADTTIGANSFFSSINRSLQVNDFPSRWQEIVGGVLGVETSFNGAATSVRTVADVSEDFLLIHWQGLARGDAELPLHKIQTSDHLSDGMLDLEAGVHLAKIEVRGHGIYEEFHSPGAHISERWVRGDDEEEGRRVTPQLSHKQQQRLPWLCELQE